MPPQPTLETLTTTSAVCLTPGVSTEEGMGKGPGRPLGSRPAKTGGNCTPARTWATRARNAGGRGAIVSRPRSKAERWICCAISGLGPREKLRRRNQHMINTANADSAAPATESVEVWTPVRRMLRRIGSPTAKPMLEPRLPPMTSTGTAPSGRALELVIRRQSRTYRADAGPSQTPTAHPADWANDNHKPHPYP